MARLQTLFQQYLNNNLTEDEFTEFWQLLQSEAEFDNLAPDLQKLWEEEISFSLQDEEWEAKMKILHSQNQSFPKSRFIPWKRYAIAASVVFTIGIISYFLLFNKDKNPEVVVISKTLSHDIIAPSATKAMITLADGTQVALDNVTSGTLTKQANVNVIKTEDGKIIYTGSASEMIYNTLTNPRGSKVIDITLADGSHVWLNAGSSVTYPVAFVGNERKVTITGEAYFEVSRHPTKKFFVQANGSTTEVLGTHFNVNSYSNEADVKVTLLEGAVKVTKQNVSGVLKPGQQAQITDKINVVSDVDIETVIAWKNGLTKFKSADIKSIMRQVERWYNVDVVFEGNMPDRTFTGGVSRDAKLSELLRILEVSNIHFRLNGQKLVVMP